MSSDAPRSPATCFPQGFFEDKQPVLCAIAACTLHHTGLREVTAFVLSETPPTATFKYCLRGQPPFQNDESLPDSLSAHQLVLCFCAMSGLADERYWNVLWVVNPIGRRFSVRHSGDASFFILVNFYDATHVCCDGDFCCLILQQDCYP